jgi:hypothetical protein
MNKIPHVNDLGDAYNINVMQMEMMIEECLQKVKEVDAELLFHCLSYLYPNQNGNRRRFIVPSFINRVLEDKGKDRMKKAVFKIINNKLVCTFDYETYSCSFSKPFVPMDSVLVVNRFVNCFGSTDKTRPLSDWRDCLRITAETGIEDKLKILRSNENTMKEMLVDCYNLLTGKVNPYGEHIDREDLLEDIAIFLQDEGLI